MTIIIYNIENNEILCTIKDVNLNFNLDNYIKQLSKIRDIPLLNIKYIYDKENKCDNLTKNSILYIENNEIFIEYNKNFNNKYFIYNNRNVNRKYTKEEILNIYYEDYINFNLHNIIKNNILKVDFIEIDKLNIRFTITQKKWEHFETDLFLKEFSKDKFLLGEDIIKNGTYYPFMVTVNNGKYYVMEGNHRIMSLKLLRNSNLIDNKKFLCIIFEDCIEGAPVLKKLNNSVILRHNIQCEYSDEIINNEKIFSELKNSLIDKGCKFIDEYTYEKETDQMEDVLRVIHSYPLWIRDLIYPYKEENLQSKVINNEEEFKKWILI